MCNQTFDRPLRTRKGKFKISWTNYKKRRFCSNKCRSLYQSKFLRGEKSPNWKGGKWCIDCGKRLNSAITNIKRCRKCYIKYNRGKNHPSWKGGKMTDKDGYIYIHKPEHPFSNDHGYIFEHRLIMEKHIKRYLKREEVVHHINRNEADNSIKNLLLLPNNSEHRKLHRSH